jgi:hypothetical protein
LSAAAERNSVNRLRIEYLLLGLCLLYIALRSTIGLTKSDGGMILLMIFFTYVLRVATGARDLGTLVSWGKMRKKALFIWLIACVVAGVQLAISPGSGYTWIAVKLAAFIQVMIFFAACMSVGELVKDKFRSRNGTS